MDYDSSAYIMFHAMNVEWPCMSFDIVRDSLGVKRTQVRICAPRHPAAARWPTPRRARPAQLPMSAYIAAGSQASEPEQNSVYVMRWSDLHRTIFDDDEDVEDDDSEGADEEASVEVRKIPHRGAVNRIRVRLPRPHSRQASASGATFAHPRRARPQCMPQQPHVSAVWSEEGSVSLFNMAGHIQSLDGPATLPVVEEPFHTYSGHRAEGFAMDWSPLTPGQCAQLPHV